MKKAEPSNRRGKPIPTDLAEREPNHIFCQTLSDILGVGKNLKLFFCLYSSYMRYSVFFLLLLLLLLLLFILFHSWIVPIKNHSLFSLHFAHCWCHFLLCHLLQDLVRPTASKFFQNSWDNLSTNHLLLSPLIK